MKKVVTVNRQTIDAALRHLREGIPINELGLDADERKRVERVFYAIRTISNHPDTDPFELFRRLAAGRYRTASQEWHAAKRDMILYNRVRNENENQKRL